MTDARLIGRAIAHLTVIGLLGFTSAVGLAAAHGDSAAFDLVSRVRGAAEGPDPLLSARIVLDPEAAREAPEPLAVRMPRETPIPKPTPIPVAADAAPLPGPNAALSIGSVEQVAPLVGPPLPGAGQATGGTLAWPVPGGSISQGFHAGHLAIDIAASGGSSVVAADGGFVTSAGWRNNGGGIVVEIDHGNGIVTLYNHLGAAWVGAGQAVARGQGIGAVGCTGICTGPHVHFEVIVNGVISNPFRYL